MTCNALGSFIDINITNASSSNGFAELFTLDGKIVSKTAIQLNGNSNQYLIKKPLQTGLYFLRIQTDGETIYRGKVIVN